MIENCLTENTEIFEIKKDDLVRTDIPNVKKYNAIAKGISEETGVPKGLIYTAPYFFYIDHWHRIENEWYFFKTKGFDFYFCNELLGEIISNYFGLDTINYKVSKLSVKGEKDKYGVASKNFCNPKYKYKRCWDYKLEPRRDLRILDDIRLICKTDQEYNLLLDDLKKFFIRDFYTAQADRTGNNFLFKIMPEGIRLAPLYDYENSFEVMDNSYYRNAIGEINMNDRNTLVRLRNDQKFQELLCLIMDANMPKFIDEVEEKHQIIVPDYCKGRYIKYDDEIKKLILKNKLIK